MFLSQFLKLRWSHFTCSYCDTIRVIVFMLHFMNGMDLGKRMRTRKSFCMMKLASTHKKAKEEGKEWRYNGSLKIFKDFHWRNIILTMTSRNRTRTSGSSKMVILKEWSLDQQQHHHLGTFYKCVFLIPHPRTTESENLWSGPVISFNKLSRSFWCILKFETLLENRFQLNKNTCKFGC